MKHTLLHRLNLSLNRSLGPVPESPNGPDLGEGGMPVVERPPALTPDHKDGTERPPMYAVLLVNDDTTPPDVVVQVLMQVFSMSGDQATQLMWTIHTGTNAKGHVGTFVKDVAETKAAQAHELGVQLMMKQGWQHECELSFLVEKEA